MTVTATPPAPSFTRQPDGPRVRFLLPPRDLGRARFIGIFLAAFGLAFTGFALFWIIAAAGLAEGGPPDPARLVFGAFGIPFLVGGMFPFRIGLLILFNARGEVIVTPTHVLARDVAGPVRWTRKVRRGRIASFDVRDGVTTSAAPNTLGRLADQSGVLVAVSTGGKPKFLAVMYPRPVLTDLARALSAELAGAPESVLSAIPEREPIPVTVTSPKGAYAADGATPAPKPPGSRIDLARIGDTVTVSVPPNGFKGPTRFLFVFSILWNAFVSVFIVSAIGGLLGFWQVQINDRPGKPGDFGFMLLFMCPFVAVGVGTLLGAINAARRKVALVITPESVVFTQQSIFGTREKQWPRKDLARAEVGPSSVSINDQPVPQLKLVFSTGKPFGLLTGRPEAELAWLAAELAVLTRPPTGAAS